ncbi:Hypothetical predicted protein [Mytilus galloprovincialis]|uniref:SCAN box domain-containing protein n=1 Tax=Mytilus galloprovincialis TaxID=29158 RepID=A0A8B6DCR6_MYTGA|nr:Hypothetical predicted protein [Mytilus galloprovincialis]
MAFDAGKFLKTPDLESFDNLKKEELVLLAKQLKLVFKVSMRKQVIKNLVIDKLVESEILGKEALDLKVENVDAFKLKQLELEHKLKLKELEMKETEKIKELEMKERLEMDKKEKEDEFKLKELELKLKELEMRERLEMEKMKIEIGKEENNTNVQSKSDYFDAAKNIRLVPKFCEKTVDKYFPQFEKIANNLKWPKPYWTTMLQSVFEGKAAEIYSALPSEKSSDYDMVKQEVLKAYELVPEAYRQKFRSYKKFDSQTYVEFAREKEDLFDKWLTSKKTDNNFDNLRQLMLLEEFKQCVHLDLKTHLDDKTVESIHDAAVISDNYTLSHKRSFKGQNVNTSSGNYKNQSTERTDSKPVSQNKSQSSYNMSSPKFDTFEKKSLTCAYCKKIGHLMADCFRLQKKNERDNKPKTSACTTPYITSTLECPASQAFKSSFCDYMEEYKPFMSDGFISIVDDTTLQPIKILRDTGASQSLLLEGVLPLSEKTSVGASVLLQGVELGCIDVPLHRIYLKSDLITGPVIVGVRPNLPVEGVTLLLGNDLARNKVVAEPIVTSEPVVDVKSPEDDAELYPACVVTRAMARKQQNENLQEDKFDYMDLSDTFIADIEDPGNSEKAIIKPPSVNKNVIMPWPDVNSHSLDRNNLLEEQHKDPENMEPILSIVQFYLGYRSVVLTSDWLYL